MDRAIEAAFLFAGRLLRTAVLLLVRPRRAVSMIRHAPPDRRDAELVSEWTYLLTTSLLAGITLRTTSGLIDGLVNERHIRALSHELRDISVGRAILGALPLIIVSVLIARIIAHLVTRDREDRRFIATLVTYALAESYLLSFLMALVPQAWSAAMGLFYLFASPSTDTRILVGFSFVFFGGMAAILLLYVVVPLVVPAVCVAHGSRWLVPQGRRRFVKTVAVFMGAFVLLALAPGTARRVYVAASHWLPEAEDSVSVVVRPASPELIDADRSCPECPALSIPVAFVNRGKAPVTIGAAKIQVTGDKVREAVANLAPFAECEWFEYPGEFIVDAGSRADVASRILGSGDVITGRVRARVPRSILQASACDETVWLRGAVMAVEVAGEDESGDTREARWPWSSLKDLCRATQDIAEQASGTITKEEALAFALTFRAGVVHAQCSFRWSSLWNSWDEERHDDAMKFLFGRTIVKSEAH